MNKLPPHSLRSKQDPELVHIILVWVFYDLEASARMQNNVRKSLLEELDVIWWHFLIELSSRGSRGVPEPILAVFSRVAKVF